MRVRSLFFVLLGILFIVLTGCSSQSTEEQIHNHLEEAVALEEEFENQQSVITDLESQEQEIYSQIIDLGMDDIEQIKELSSEALSIIDEREEKIELEKESIESSQKEFSNIDDLISKIEDADLKEKAEKMYEVMDNRYSVYAELNEAYLTSLEKERKLYTMLEQEDLEQKELTNHINSINETYEQVLDLNEQFNNYTVEYNALKKEFYEAAELDIAYES